MIKRILCVIAVLLLGCAHAKTVGCIDAKLIGVGLIDRVCWSCVFPIRVAGIPISGASQANRYPQEAAKQKFCMCNDSAGVPHPGIVTSFWQPAYLAEYQRVSGCSSVLNGIRFPTNRLFQGSERRSAEDVNKGQLTFRHYHFYSFPLMHMLDVFVPANCNPGGFHDLDMMYISELDPTWNNDELAFFTSFEAALVSNPLGIAACVADVPATLAGRPLQPLWWCAGSWGHVYPLSGNVGVHSGHLNTTSLMLAKTVVALHRRGLMHGTVGDEMLCGGRIMPRIPKYQYRFTLAYPRPETQSSHVYGETSFTWGTNRIIPAVGEDPIYIIWRWLDCCNT